VAFRITSRFFSTSGHLGVGHCIVIDRYNCGSTGARECRVFKAILLQLLCCEVCRRRLGVTPGKMIVSVDDKEILGL